MARVVNTSNLTSTYFGGGRIYSVVCDEKLENGMIGVIGNLKEGEKELREFTKVTDITKGVELGLVASPEIMYDERPSMRRLENFEIPAGTPARVYSLSVGGEFEVSIDAIQTMDSTPTNDIGKFVVLKNNTFVFEKKDDIDGETAQFICRIEDITNMNRPLQLSKDKKLPLVTKMARLKIIKYVNQ